MHRLLSTRSLHTAPSTRGLSKHKCEVTIMYVSKYDVSPARAPGALRREHGSGTIHARATQCILPNTKTSQREGSKEGATKVPRMSATPPFVTQFVRGACSQRLTGDPNDNEQAA